MDHTLPDGQIHTPADSLYLSRVTTQIVEQHLIFTYMQKHGRQAFHLATFPLGLSDRNGGA
jgi:hypothetical protein